MHTYYNPVRIFSSFGELEKLPEIAISAIQGDQKILFLVWDSKALEHRAIKSMMVGCEWRAKVFSASNPDVNQLFELHNELESDFGLVVAIGGGSVLDMGKSLCALHGKEFESVDELRSYIAGKNYGNLTAKWIGVPTTAGTGSEVTCWATVWDFEKNAKLSVDTVENYSYAAIIDSELLLTMPTSLAISSALDAVAHATESYWANARNCVSSGLALQAIKKIMSNIDLLWDDEKRKDAFSHIAEGSFLAGLAFSNTRTTACHSISYPLTMKYSIPHGAAVAMLLAPVFRLNMPCIDDSEALLNAYNVKNINELDERICSLLQKAACKAKLREWGAVESDLDALAAAGITKGRADNNPVDLNLDVVKKVLESIY